MVAKRREQAKTSRSERPRRRHLDDGSFARLPPVNTTKPHLEGIRQYDSSDTGHSDNVNIAAEHQEPAEVLSQLDNTSNSPVYGEYKCC